MCMWCVCVCVSEVRTVYTIISKEKMVKWSLCMFVNKFPNGTCPNAEKLGLKIISIN